MSGVGERVICPVGVSVFRSVVHFWRGSDSPGGGTRLGDARRRAFGQLASVVIVVVAISVYVQLAPRRPLPAARVAEVVADHRAHADQDEDGSDEEAIEPSVAAVQAVAPAPVAVPAPAPAPVPELDRAAVACAEGALDAASRDRARADERANESARRLALASGRAALDAARARKLAFLVRDPSTRIAQASSRGGFLRGERDKLEKEVSTLRQLPRPKSTSILSKSPVARPAAGSESHFELRHNRVSFIDLERLLEITKADAQLRIRMSDQLAAISNKVGPVGSFSLEYELVKAVPASMEELIERRVMRRYDLRAWEIVPEFENRGETYEGTRNPISDFSRSINRINPARTTITLWVYPDSFGLYRRLRNELVERGFSVAARPLPDGMTIRGSPRGTQSAAQ
jgi:hypothetical protein